MKPILEVRNIWKEYKIGGKQQRYLSLRDSLTKTFKLKPKPEKFWALKDISFDIYEGECVGIIGRNGAGKSTLLKILSKITPPSKGYIKARGRVASLLEVGTGFHPELTGRENIYLNGSILGLRRVEINRKFDEIVDFSGVEKFLDTPLKHYSSGMQLRLAFSVAAFLEPEVLLIDEVLAVGDAEFQKKCLGKMDEVSKSGRTVLFVSHNLDAVRQLCSRGILLENGKIIFNDVIENALSRYYQQVDNLPEQHSFFFKKYIDSGFKVKKITLEVNGISSNKLEIGDSLSFRITFSSEVAIHDYIIGFVINSRFGNLLNANNKFQHSQKVIKPINSGEIICDLGKIPFNPGSYFVDFWVGPNPGNLIRIKDEIHFKVIGKDIWGKGRLPAKASPLWQKTDFKIIEHPKI